MQFHPWTDRVFPHQLTQDLKDFLVQSEFLLGVEKSSYQYAVILEGNHQVVSSATLNFRETISTDFLRYSKALVCPAKINGFQSHSKYMNVCEIGPLEELNLSDNGPVDLLMVEKTTWFSIRREHVTCLQLVSFVIVQAFE